MLDATARYLIFAGLALVGPGIGVQRLSRVPLDPALILPLGTALTAGGFALASMLGLPWIFPLLVVALDIFALLPPCRLERAPGPSLRAAAPAFIAMILVLAATQYPWNRVGASGDFLLDGLVPFDATFHVGLTHELAAGYPPQIPGVAGIPIGYHLGTDLVRAAALRWASTDPFDSLSRFDVTLWALALVLAVRAATARLTALAFPVVLVPWTLLASDFSFLLFRFPQAHWWTDLLRGNLLLSLCHANPVIPALGLALGSLVALSRFEAERRPGWLVLAAFQGAAVPFFKVFLGAHLVLGLAVAWLRSTGPTRIALALVAGLAAGGTVVHVLGPGGSSVRVEWAPLDLVLTTRQGLGLPEAEGLGLLAWALFWVAASLGLRLAGLGAALRAFRGRDTLAVCLAAMALSAWPLGLALRVSAREVLPTERAVNDAAYLVEQGGALLWVFTAVSLGRLAHSRERRLAVWLVVAALAFPSTGQFMWKKWSLPPDPIPAPMVRAARSLERASRPGDVVLQRPAARYPPVPVILAGRRVPFERFTPYLTQFAPRQTLEARHRAVHRFFRTRDVHEASAIAIELGASYVYLFGQDRVRFDPAGFWAPIHEESGARVYRILGPERSRPGAAGAEASR